MCLTAILAISYCFYLLCKSYQGTQKIMQKSTKKEKKKKHRTDNVDIDIVSVADVIAYQRH